MEKINKLNVGQICSVKSRLTSYSNNYEYKKAKRILFFWKQKEGYYYTLVLGDHTYMTVEEIEKDGVFICKNEKVFLKPHLEIKMSNGCVFDKYFEKEKDLFDFMETETMKGVNFINL